MGGDGGSIPQREDLIRTQQKAQRFDKAIENTLKWRLCTLTQQPLKLPIVVCGLGRLYVKEALIEGLLSRGKGKTPKEGEDPLAGIAHIRSMKEVCDAKLAKNPAFDVEKDTDQFADANLSAFNCPVVGLELNGVHRFVIIWSCGHVLSEKALRTVPSEHMCLVCGELYIDEDVVFINPKEEEKEGYMQRIRQRRALRRKIKKAVKEEPTEEGEEADRPPVAHLVDKEAAVQKSITTKEEDASKADRKRAGASAVKLAKERKLRILEKGAVATDIQLDATTSNTYKQLFTSSKKGQNQPRAHWVTHNPQYY